MDKSVKIGLMGLGTVGTGVCKILQDNREVIFERAGTEFEIAKILVRDLTKPRAVEVEEGLLTTNPADILEDDGISVVVELMGGLEPAYQYIEAALSRGKHVVTANKAVIAAHGARLIKLARNQGVDLYYEGSVGGGIPIIKPLRESLVGNRIEEIMGIVNGTTNYILTRMTQEGAAFDEVLKEAQALGYAEAEPAADIEGQDAANKLVILASLAFQTPISLHQVYCEGISRITPDDIAFAEHFGYIIKLLAIAKRRANGIEARVHPTFLPKEHPLASVNGVFNGIFVRGDAVGELMFYGRGAGDLPTGSAIIADIVDVLRNRRRDSHHRVETLWTHIPVKPMDDVGTRYYVRLHAQDKPGVLAQVAASFGAEGVSIESMIQQGRGQDQPVPIVFITHEVEERQMQASLKRIATLPSIKDIANVIRVEGGMPL
ncbi:MAG: homoserine dehydrogenase [Firmicutes bacterium]|nr:homoserine dehydrogenase [Bacillota bacterium]